MKQMKHTRELERIANSLESIERALWRLAIVAERAERTMTAPIRVAKKVLVG